MKTQKSKRFREIGKQRDELRKILELSKPKNTPAKCHLCHDTGLFTYGGSFGGATMTQRCSCQIKLTPFPLKGTK